MCKSGKFGKKHVIGQKVTYKKMHFHNPGIINNGSSQEQPDLLFEMFAITNPNLITKEIDMQLLSRRNVIGELGSFTWQVQYYQQGIAFLGCVILMQLGTCK